VESTKISVKEKSHRDNNFSKYGRHEIQNDLELDLPGNKITFTKLGEGKFSYQRVDLQNEVIKKVIATRTKNLEIELAPALPIHLPAYKTDFMFLRLTNPLQIGKHTSTKLSISIPIEVGIYNIDGMTVQSIEYLLCPPSYSKYGLYGEPENGQLCNYATVSLDTSEKIQHFAFGTMHLEVKNELEKGVSLGRIVFPITDHDMYYSDGETAFDPLEVIVKDRMGFEYAETKNSIKHLPSMTKAPRDTPKTDYKFSMEMGFD
jgi:hypothetical protein